MSKTHFQVCNHTINIVILAKADSHLCVQRASLNSKWTPVFAGMTA